MVKLRQKPCGRLANGNMLDLIDETRKLTTEIELANVTERNVDQFNGIMIRLKRANAELRLATNYVKYGEAKCRLSAAREQLKRKSYLHSK